MTALVPAVLFCPSCGERHVERGKWARFNHKRHLCYGCGSFFEVPEANVGVPA